ncbi:Astacin (Peptidase family M12A) [Ruegeria halocynthiae]|uniref:Astacin (Peptidase family M12A) n=1 Tax=Ruegeria halocynthiae TaxID=985054 RepID=A0A1H3FSH1_9RHOB|nr:GDSL-type esterase/lipase family protein [Ruegeria halocynthiae]SDX93946.1 Astacin (Peptidase family M12A) [Ruegeria halocynthiae]
MVDNNRTAPIPTDELRRMLFDPTVPDETLAKYMVLDPGASRPFAPVVRVNPALIQPPAAGSGLNGALQGALALGGLNDISRSRRRQEYRSKIAGGWTGLKIVSEGDSWFQYPFLLKDVIDHLSKNHAILSLGAAGDTLDDVFTQNELVTAVLAERPDAVLLSGGGNDLLGGGNLATIVRPFTPGLDALGHITSAFDIILAEVTRLVRNIANGVAAAAPGTPILTHTYDHAIPDDGRWLGRPLQARGIVDTGLQREIIEILIDRWAQALFNLAREPGLSGKLHIVDCRGLIPDNGWEDELHPDSKSFAKAAQQFEAMIQRVTRDSQPVGALGAMGTLRRPEPEETALANTILDLADHFDETILLSEIGRRASLERTGPTVAMMAMRRDISSVPDSSLSGGYPTLRRLGARILARAHRELHGLLCGDDDADKSDREALRDAFNIGQGALAAAIAGLLASGPLGLTAFVAAPVAAIIVRRFLAPSWEETCTLWGEKLNEGGTAHASVRIAQHGIQAVRKNPDRFCVSFKRDAAPDDTQALEGSKAALLDSAKWPLNSVIRIRFLGGSTHLREQVEQFACQWVADEMAALTFEFVEEGDAEVRVAFQQGAGSWSLLGTDCLNEPDQTKPTMNFGWLTDQSGTEEIREVVLHEFGHALGLIHEHQNPDGGIEWNEDAVKTDLSGAPNFWDDDTIRRNVLNHYDPGTLTMTKIDPYSIMMYPIPNKWTVGNFETGFNTDFSPADRELIRRAYPSL